MDERIERFLERIEPSTEAKLKRYISSRARDIIWNEARRTQYSSEDRRSYVEEKYWGRVKYVFQTLLEKLYHNRDDLLPSVSEKQIYSIASKVRKPFEKAIREIEPIPNIEPPRVGDRKLILENKIIVSPAVALIYGIRDREMVELSSEKHYGKVRRQVKVERFNGNVDFTVKLNGKDIKLIFGLDSVPKAPIDVKYKIRKIVGRKEPKGTEESETTG